ncbi:MAG: hypothetical protein U1E53_08555 [Dongiaceae bacterium]
MSLRRGLAGALALAIMVLVAAGARAADLPAVGTSLTDRLLLLGRPVPLPAGAWDVLGTGFGRVDGPSPGPYGALVGVMLVHRGNQGIDGIVLAATNALPVEGGWGPAPQCGAPAMAFATEVKQLAQNLSCAFVMPAGAGLQALSTFPGWAAGAAEAARRGWTLPPQPVVAGLRASDRRDAVGVLYGFAADSVGAQGDPPGPLAPWTEAAERQLAGGLLGGTAAGPLPWPGPDAALPGEPGGDAGRSRVALYKTATNVVMQTGITYAVGMFLTGDPYSSAVLSFWQAVTHAALFYANEMYWERPAILPAMAFVAGEGRS